VTQLVLSRALALLGAALWLGGGVGTLLSTRAAFRHAGGTPVAGQIAADALRSLARLTWASLALLALAAALGARAPLYAWLPGAALFLAGELGVKPALRKMRQDAGGSIEHLPAGDARRKQFGALHGVSMLLLLGQLLCAAATLLVLAH
jgi:hypothetical protein